MKFHIILLKKHYFIRRFLLLKKACVILLLTSAVATIYVAKRANPTFRKKLKDITQDKDLLKHLKRSFSENTKEINLIKEYNRIKKAIEKFETEYVSK